MFGAEFRKLFSSRAFMICLVLFLVINTAAFYFISVNDEIYGNQLAAGEEYKTALAKYLSMDTEAAKTEIAFMQEAYQIASDISSLSNSDLDAEYIESVAEGYKSESPKAFEKAQELIKNGYNTKMSLATDLVAHRFNYIDQYENFIGKMHDRADSQLKFAIFSKPGTFAYNNIAKTPSDFEHLKGTKITPGFDLGVNLATDFELTDYLTLFLAILVCITLYSAERDKKLTIFVKSTPRGRVATLLVKLCVTTFSVAGFTVVYYASVLIVSEIAFGLGDLSRSIQSMPQFMNCNLKVSVFGYLCFWVMQKVLTLCSVSMIFAMLFTLIKSTNITYIVVAILLGAEFVCFNFTDSHAIVNHFKYINIFYYLRGNGLFGSYLNLNFFTNPVNVLWTYLGFICLCFGVCSTVSAVAFTKQKQVGTKNPFGKLTDTIRRKIRIFSHSTTVFGGECFKHYISSKVLLAILALLVFAYGGLTDDISITYFSGEDVAYSAYLDRIKGEVDEGKIEFLENEQAYFDSLYSEIEAIRNDSDILNSEKEMKIAVIDNILETRGKGFESVMLQYSDITKLGEELGLTPHFINKNIGNRLMANSNREWRNFALLMVLSAFTLSGVFAYEHKREMSNLIFATKKGKERLYFSKLAVATITYSVIYILLYLPYMLNFIKTFGTDVLYEPLVFLEGFDGLYTDMSIMGALILESVAHILAGFAALAFILLMSEKLRSNMIAMTVSTAVTFIPCLIVFFDPEFRLFSFYQNGKPWMITAIIVAAAVIAVLLLVYNFISFAGKVRRRCGNGT